jgi:hypothetical protein
MCFRRFGAGAGADARVLGRDVLAAGVLRTAVDAGVVGMDGIALAARAAAAACSAAICASGG